MDIVPFGSLVGKTVESVVRGECNGRDTLTFNCAGGESYTMYHDLDCCETVTIEDICGDLDDLIGSPILFAEESSQDTAPDGVQSETYGQKPQWTFYRLRTNKGSVVIRWFGASDYYSTSVSFGRRAA